MKRLFFILTLLLIFTLHAELAVVVTKSAGITRLSKQEVERIFLGKEKRLPNGSRAVVIDNDNQNLYSEFYQEVSGKSPSQIRSYRAKLVFTGKAKPPLIKTNAQIITFLKDNKDAIAYMPDNDIPSTLQVVYTLR